MTVRVARRGPAGKYEMWSRCVHPDRWATWMTLIRRVEAAGPLRPDLEGELILVGGVRIRFEVLEVNPDGPSWSRELRLGPFDLVIEHHVDEGFGLVAVDGPLPIALAYVPFARRSLSRLLRRGRHAPLPVE